jgi:hypothetical protein
MPDRNQPLKPRQEQRRPAREALRTHEHTEEAQDPQRIGEQRAKQERDRDGRQSNQQQED